MVRTLALYRPVPLGTASASEALLPLVPVCLDFPANQNSPQPAVQALSVPPSAPILNLFSSPSCQVLAFPLRLGGRNDTSKQRRQVKMPVANRKGPAVQEATQLYPKTVPSSPALTNNPAKRRQFVKVAGARLRNTLDALDLLGQAADKDRHEFSARDIAYIRAALMEEVEKTIRKFERGDPRPEIRFPDEDEQDEGWSHDAAQ